MVANFHSLLSSALFIHQQILHLSDESSVELNQKKGMFYFQGTDCYKPCIMQ